jgi:hypothetical protein
MRNSNHFRKNVDLRVSKKNYLRDHPNLGTAFERFVERKWKDALNVAAAEPQPWEPEGPKKERMTSSKAAAEKAPQGQKGVAKTVGAANVVTQQPTWGTQQPTWGHRKCRVRSKRGAKATTWYFNAAGYGN